jgi:hypothetical protein
MEEHRLVTWKPSFRKYVQDYEGDGEWSPSYLKRGGIYKPDFADNQYECTCGESFGTNEDAAKEHVKEYAEVSL